MAPTDSKRKLAASDLRTLFYLVRYKPAPPAADGTGFLESAVKDADSFVNDAKKGVNDLASAIPGLKMFIKEEKKDSTSQKEYKYDYAEWDIALADIKSNLAELFPENKTEVFDFSSTDFKGRKADGEKLFNKITSALSSWSNYNAQVILVGLGQGGNVINECMQKLAADNSFNKENWHVQQLAYVATPLYKDEHKLDITPFKNKGKVIHAYNAYDITHRVIEYFDDKDKLLKAIDEINKSTLTFLVGKIQLQIINVLKGIVTTIQNFADLNEEQKDGKNFGDDTRNKVDKTVKEFENRKNDISECLQSIISLKDTMAEELNKMLDTSSLKQFENAVGLIASIPEKTASQFIEDITKKGEQIADRAAKKASNAVTYQAQKLIDENLNRHTGGGSSAKEEKTEDIVQKKDLAALFHCLHQPLMIIKQSLQKIGEKKGVGNEMANAIIKRTGIKKIHVPLKASGQEIDCTRDDPYNKKVVDLYTKENKTDKVKSYINNLCDDFEALAAKNANDLTATDPNDHKLVLAEILYTLMRPMLISKEMVMREILSWLGKLNLSDLLKDDFFSSVGMKPLKLFSSKELLDELAWYNSDITGIQQELNRLKGFFDRFNYDLMEDTLYFIYNSHNTIIQKPSPELLYTLDKSSGVLEMKLANGYINTFPLSYKYEPKDNQVQTNTLTATTVPEPQNT